MQTTNFERFHGIAKRRYKIPLELMLPLGRVSNAERRLVAYVRPASAVGKGQKY